MPAAWNSATTLIRWRGAERRCRLRQRGVLRRKRFGSLCLFFGGLYSRSITAEAVSYSRFLQPFPAAGSRSRFPQLIPAAVSDGRFPAADSRSRFLRPYPAAYSCAGLDHPRFIELKNSSFDLVFFILSSMNSMAASSSIGCSSLRRIQIFCSMSGSINSSSRRVPERLMSMAG